MKKGLKIIFMMFGSFIVVTVLHLWLNVGVDRFWTSSEQERFRVGYLPVT